MPERQQPDRGNGTRLVTSDGMPDIDTPLIDMQDLEHKPGWDTRVNTKGVVVHPPTGPLPELELETLEQKDEESRDAVAELEKELRKLPPG